MSGPDRAAPEPEDDPRDRARDRTGGPDDRTERDDRDDAPDQARP